MRHGCATCVNERLHVYGEHTFYIFVRGLSNQFGEEAPGVAIQDVQPAEAWHASLHQPLVILPSGHVRLNEDSFSPGGLDLVEHRVIASVSAISNHYFL